MRLIWRNQRRHSFGMHSSDAEAPCCDSEIVFLTEANVTHVNRLPDQFWAHDVWEAAHFPVDAAGNKQTTARIMNDERHRGQVNLLYLDGQTGTKHYREITHFDYDYGAGEASAPGHP